MTSATETADLAIATAKKPTAGPSCFTVAEVATRYRVKAHNILALIRGKKLRAKDISVPGSKRPLWRITPQAIAEFEQGTDAREEPAAQPRQKKTKPVVDFVSGGRIDKQFKKVGSVKAALGDET